jgi:predicted secreted protein
MKKRVFIISLLLIALVLVGAQCGKEEEQPVEEEEFRPGGSEEFEVQVEELSMEVKKGENFKISLEGNLTTGYYWGISFDCQCIEFVDLEYIPDDPELAGSPGQQVFELKAVEETEGAEITFSYERSWDNELPLEKKIYTIIIK